MIGKTIADLAAGDRAELTRDLFEEAVHKGWLVAQEDKRHVSRPGAAQMRLERM